MADDEIELSEATACPLLGLPFDRRTHYTFPDPAHRCFAEKRLTTPDAVRQAAYCLSGSFRGCEWFERSQHPDAVAYRSNLPATVEPLVVSSPIPTTPPGVAEPSSVAPTVPAATAAIKSPRRRARKDVEAAAVTAAASPSRPTWRDAEPAEDTTVVSPRRRLWRDAAGILLVTVLGVFVYSLVVSPGRSPASGTVEIASPTAPPSPTPAVVASPSPTPFATMTPTPTLHPSPTPTPVATATPSPSPVPTPSPTPTRTPTPKPTVRPTPQPTVQPTPPPTPVRTPTPTPTQTPVVITPPPAP